MAQSEQFGLSVIHAESILKTTRHKAWKLKSVDGKQHNARF